MKYKYTLYDTIVFGTALQGEQKLFQTISGGDTTHSKDFTNMRGSGALPQQEKFTIQKVGVFVDFNNLVQTDIINVWIKNYLEIRIADNSVLLIPLRAAAQYNGFNGFYSQAAAANGVLGGLVGDGYDIDPSIELAGGTPLAVNVPQNTVMTVANVLVRVLLHGILDR